ncbi:hypothetical protein [Pelotalea chapellei]|uniref:Cytochrome c7-like domain-containing protein n=1 Tax=Pelotalea chapellei TaxID=44671 RepID=A0ABS5U953_9BACT|nr:hypothetical protein [Pelotalea chapellei]MBT1072213.1 hypothetical protein [Pelotalea chapellei]
MKLRMALLNISFLILVACSSSSNEKAPTTTNAHEPGWITMHDEQARQSLTQCQVCHEKNFSGNPPAPGCGECHTFGIAPFVIHPPYREIKLAWSHPSNHGWYAKENIKLCQGCHSGLGPGPGSNPRFNRPLGNLEAGCESAAGCHNNNDLINSFTNGHNPRAAHPSLDPQAPSKQDLRHWYGENIVYRAPDGVLKNAPLNHSTAGNVTSACALCHGAQLQGGVGPACMDCHVLDPIANPSRCVSCHGPIPGQQQSAPQKPSQLARLAGRTDMLSRNTFRNFTSQLISRMRLDHIKQMIEKKNPNQFLFFSYTTVTGLSGRSSHLHHDTLPCADRQNNATCSQCHTANRVGFNRDRHHDLMFSRGLGCLNCHKLNGGFAPFRDCKDCHREHFCN